MTRPSFDDIAFELREPALTLGRYGFRCYDQEEKPNGRLVRCYERGGEWDTLAYVTWGADRKHWDLHLLLHAGCSCDGERTLLALRKWGARQLPVPSQPESTAENETDDRL